MILAQDLGEKERSERDIDNDPLVNGFPDHLAHELEEVEVRVRHVTHGAGVQSLLRRCAEEVQAWIEDLLDCLLKELFEHAVLVDPGLVQALDVHEFDPDNAF